MATYIVLANFTDQGIRNIKDTTKRADAFKELAKSLGATVLQDVMEIGEIGTMSVIQDPTGAVIALWQARRAA